MAQPPGSETRASPQRATRGPRTRIEARMVFTRSYGASGSGSRSARSNKPSRSSSDTSTPSCVSSASHISWSAAFFAPETRTSPERGAPPPMMSLSIRGFFGRERMHRQRVDLAAHALAERRIDELVALHWALAAERLAHDQSLEMLTVAHDPYPGALKPLLD